MVHPEAEQAVAVVGALLVVAADGVPQAGTRVGEGVRVELTVMGASAGAPAVAVAVGEGPAVEDW